MELKNILVHVDPTERAKERINIAMTMAAPAGGHVTGIYVIPNPSLPVFMDASYVSAEMLNARHEQATENANVARKWFEQAATASGVLCEWRTEQGQAAEVVTRSARYMDVTIVGKGDRRDPEHFPYPELPADLVMSSGRPVLVVPNAGQFESVGKRVLICWNATREATRAVNDSMPILQTADKVTVLTVNPHRPEGGDHGESPGADIALQLARHGVNVESMRSVAKDISIADTILARASDLGVDLIVSGAYGHSRSREWVFGGVTESLLRDMTVPCLMSH